MKTIAPVVRSSAGPEPASVRPGFFSRLRRFWTHYLTLPLGCEIAARRIGAPGGK